MWNSGSRADKASEVPRDPAQGGQGRPGVCLGCLPGPSISRSQRRSGTRGRNPTSAGRAQTPAWTARTAGWHQLWLWGPRGRPRRRRCLDPGPTQRETGPWDGPGTPLAPGTPEGRLHAPACVWGALPLPAPTLGVRHPLNTCGSPACHDAEPRPTRPPPQVLPSRTRGAGLAPGSAHPLPGFRTSTGANRTQTEACDKTRVREPGPELERTLHRSLAGDSRAEPGDATAQRPCPAPVRPGRRRPLCAPPGGAGLLGPQGVRPSGGSGRVAGTSHPGLRLGPGRLAGEAGPAPRPAASDPAVLSRPGAEWDAGSS